MNDFSAQSNDSSESEEFLAWAEFLYEEFMRYKHKQFLSQSKNKIIDPYKESNND